MHNFNCNMVRARWRNHLKLILLSVGVWMLTACGNFQNTVTPAISEGQPDVIADPSADAQTYKPTPLLWEGANKNGILWSAFVYQMIGSELAPTLFAGGQDMNEFCPNYSQLSDAQKANFWAYLLSAMAKYESGFNPDSQSLGRAGLLGLNPQSCGENNVSPLTDPLGNLACGAHLLAAQITTTGKIAPDQGSAFSALDPHGHISSLIGIERLTQSLPFCQMPELP